MAIEDEIADIVKTLDGDTGRLVADGLKRVNDENKRSYAEAVVEIHKISPRVGRKAAEKIWELKSYDGLKAYAKIVKFWAARNPFDAVDGAEKLPAWLQKVGDDDRDAYAESVTSINWPGFLSIEAARRMAGLNKKERADYAKAYAQLVNKVGGIYYKLDRAEASQAEKSIFGLVKDGKLKEAETYVASLAGRQAEVEQAKL